MQLGRARLSSEERLRRIRAGECLYCGKPGHFVSTCPVHPNGGGLISKFQGADEPQPYHRNIPLKITITNLCFSECKELGAASPSSH